MTDAVQQYQRCSVHYRSPGPLSDQECLVRIYYQPLDADFEKAVVGKDDINGTNGRSFSVNREAYTYQFQLIELKNAQTIRNPEKRKVAEIVTFDEVQRFREMDINGARPLIAFDDAMPADPKQKISPNSAHASVVSTTPLLRDGLSEVRVQFRKCVTGRYPFDQKVVSYPKGTIQKFWNILLDILCEFWKKISKSS